MAIPALSVSSVVRAAMSRPATIPVLFGLLVLAACQPSVQVKAPTEPITINLNVRVDAEVRVKLEKQAEEDIRGNADIF
jgi:hypothetical protein